ncbi:MAG: hypothetical protein K2H19_03015 [Ruminococcus sp.]|nr:hypothetical protein [Ruminococcus sp.]
MEDTLIHTCFKGYNKEEVLNRIDKLNVLIMAVESGKISSADAEIQAEQIASGEIKTSFYGFNRKDTDKYINELINKIHGC